MPLMLLIDLILIVLLVSVLVAGWILHRKLADIRRDRAELAEFADRFGDAIARAEHSIGNLKLSTESLRQETEASQTLAEDMRFLIERGTTVADRLEKTIRESRNVEPVVPFRRPISPSKGHPSSPAAASADGQPSAKRRVPSAAERELLKALRAGN